MATYLKPRKAKSFDEYIDHYYLYPTDHSFYRSWTIDKFVGGFGVSYIFLRELPFRNFYARFFLMYVFFAKVFDHFSPVPYIGKPG